MKRVLFILLAVIAIMGGCGKENTHEEEIPKLLEVELSLTPDKSEVNESITFQALVSQGDEEVTDADEVKFEIWRSKDEHHEMTVAKHSKDGIYEVEKLFDQEGTYYVYAHVTARGMHSMPKKEFIVGQPSDPEDGSSSQMKNMKEHDDSSDGDSTEHH